MTIQDSGTIHCVYVPAASVKYLMSAHDSKGPVFDTNIHGNFKFIILEVEAILQ